MALCETFLTTKEGVARSFHKMKYERFFTNTRYINIIYGNLRTYRSGLMGNGEGGVLVDPGQGLAPLS